MARCRRCHKGGLFKHVNSNRYCESCQAIVDKEDELHRIEDRISAVKKELSDNERLLSDAKASAMTQAQRQLADDHARYERENEQITIQLAEKRNRLESTTKELDAVEKKRQTAENRIAKAKPLFDSMKYAMERFMKPELTLADFRKDFSLSDYESIAPIMLNCLTMKELRSQYRQIEKTTREVCEAYQGRYTTKSNAALYKLMVLALEAELQNILNTINYGKLDDALEKVRTLTAKYYVIATEGNQNIAPTMKRFIGQIEDLYTQAVKVEYEYYVKRERAKEEQRAIKEQMRQEAEERKLLEQQRKQVEAEEKKYSQEIERIYDLQTQAKNDNNQSEIDKLNKRLAELQVQLSTVEERKEEITKLQNGKAGTVYIISNIGSFGDDVFKVGMTRRLEPMDRVNELGDASVPFPFDVHSFIFSQDAVSLESTLHRELNERRLNKVNLRREFFKITVEEIQTLVERYEPTAAFKTTALAEQYRQSLSISSVPNYGSEINDDEEQPA